MADIRAGDVGTVLRFAVKDERGAVVDLSTATLKVVVIVGPNMATSTPYRADFVTDGTDGLIEIPTIAEMFPTAGTWRMQVHIVTPAGEWRSTIQHQKVEPAL